MYQLTETTIILRLEDGAWIPADPANRDYAEYLEWLAEGNEPLPAAPAPAPPAPLPYDPTTEPANPTVAEWNALCEAANAPELMK